MRLAAGIFALSLLGGATASQATVLYTETFNDYTGGYAGTQYLTNLKVEAVGAVSGYTPYGMGALHAVDRTGTGDWAIMLYGGGGGTTNQLVSNPISNVNTAGTVYTLNFQDAGAVYQVASQASKTGDYFVIQVLDGANTILSQMSAGQAFTAANPFINESLSYTGSGVGGVTLNIFAVSGNDFAGAIDNITISDASVAVPEPASMALLGAGLLGAGMLRRRKQIEA